MAHAQSWDVIAIQRLLLHEAAALGSQDQGAGKPPLPFQCQPCCPRGAGRQQSLCAKLLALRAAPRCPTTYLLFFGWYPQKEMFFSWKKWLHLFTWGTERGPVKAFLRTTSVGQSVSGPWKYVLGLSGEINWSLILGCYQKQFQDGPKHLHTWYFSRQPCWLPSQLPPAAPAGFPWRPWVGLYWG